LKTIQIAETNLTPGKIVCVGRNYVGHVKELNNEMPKEPVIFMKPNSAITGQLRSFDQEQLHFEGEISFVYQNGGFSAVGFGLDITKRDLQRELKVKGLPWERCKSFDGSALFSRFVKIDAVSPELKLELYINNELAQQGSIELMIYKPQEVLKSLSKFLSLNDGDVVMTGTPAGVGGINSGDKFEGRIYDGDTLLTSAEWTAL
jgi:2-keto-4-pentenoate hydratase/2-oxohepta-3-ene-1,7-dioic acid hydratase in catechol pathway